MGKCAWMFYSTTCQELCKRLHQHKGSESFPSSIVLHRTTHNTWLNETTRLVLAEDVHCLSLKGPPILTQCTPSYGDLINSWQQLRGSLKQDKCSSYKGPESPNMQSYCYSHSQEIKCLHLGGWKSFLIISFQPFIFCCSCFLLLLPF